MAFRLKEKTFACPETPEALLYDLRNRKIEGPLAHQADMMREYIALPQTETDIALQLPTGSGKTLVGLLIGEWRRRKNNERVVYLCPTRQLVNQVAEQANEKFGMKVRAFTGKQSNYSSDAKAEFANSEVMAITTYSSLFNTNPYFDNPDVIIFDDAHAAENYVSKYWSLSVERKNTSHSSLFSAISALLKQVITPGDYSRLVSDSPDNWDLGWVEKVPSPKLLEISDKFISIVDAHAGSSDLQYPWSVLRDYIFACHLYLSWSTILLRPLIAPTLTHTPFRNAKQRLYMSATLGEGGELERLFGIEKVKRLPIPKGWDQHGVGRRLFFFPERSLGEAGSESLVIKMIQATPRTLVLVPDDSSETEFAKVVSTQTDREVFNAEQIEQTKLPFVTSPKAVAVVANRYDGIDLLGDECRLLIVKGLPRATNLQERFLGTRMAAYILFNDRVMTRVVQAVGRCTRSSTDYSAVVILGDELGSYFMQRENRERLHPELQAEVELGIDESKDCTEMSFLDNFRIFREHNVTWVPVDDAIIKLRQGKTQQPLQAKEKLIASAFHEVRYQYSLWKGDYEHAIEACRTVATLLSGDDVKGYRAFWQYLGGSAARYGVFCGRTELAAVARDFFQRALAISSALPWLIDLKYSDGAQNSVTPSPWLAAVIEGLESNFETLGMSSNRKYDEENKFISENLSSLNSKKFESAHERLGKHLGYKAFNVKTNGSPDPYWLVGDSLCIVFEDHSDTNGENAFGVSKTRQAASHPNWIRANVPLCPTAKVLSVVITPCIKIDTEAIPHTADVCYWHIDEFRAWSENAMAVVRQARTSYSGPGNVTWREKVAKDFCDAGIDPDNLVKQLESNRLRNLPEAKNFCK